MSVFTFAQPELTLQWDEACAARQLLRSRLSLPSQRLSGGRAPDGSRSGSFWGVEAGEHSEELARGGSVFPCTHWG